MKKRFFSALLALCLAVSLVPPIPAAAVEIVDSGTCGAQGDNLTWTLDSEGTLTISGTGEMKGYSDSDYASPGLAPWTKWRYNSTVVIQKAVIEEGVTSIGYYAFSGCSHMKEVSIPDSVTSIGSHAFWACRALEIANIPAGVTTIEQSTFRQCDSLVSVTMAGPITSVGQGAFGDCFSLADIRLPKTVSRIGQYAFEDCKSLPEIWIPDGVQYLSSKTFSGCESLISITIPASVIEIGYATFTGCTALRDIYFGGTKSQWQAFLDKSWGGQHLVLNEYTAVHCADGDLLPGGETTEPTPTPTPSPTPTPPSSGMCGAPGYSVSWKVEDHTLYIEGLGDMKDFTHPDGEDPAPWYAWKDDIQHVVVGESLASRVFRIGDYAFYGLDKCESITLGQGLETVGAFALAARNELPIFLAEECKPKSFDKEAFTYFPTVYCACAPGEESALLERIENWDQIIYKVGNLNADVNWVYSEPAISKLDEKNLWGFANDFEKGKEDNGYFITKADYNRLMQNLNVVERAILHFGKDMKMRYNTDGADINKGSHISWDGSCSGMCAIVAAVATESLYPFNMPGAPKSLSEAKLDNSLKSALHFYQFQQCLSAVKKHGDQVQDCSTQKEQLQMLDSMVRQAEKNGSFVKIGFDYYDGSEKAHAVLGYAVEDGVFTRRAYGLMDTFTHRVLIYDPNEAGSHQTLSQKAIYYNDHMWAYGTTAYSTTTAIHKNLKTDNAQLTSLIADMDYINAIDYRTGFLHYKDPRARDSQADTVQYIHTVSKNLTLTIDGEDHEIQDGFFDGEATASSSGARISFTEEGNGYTISLPEGTEYNISGDEPLACSLETDNYFLNVGAASGGFATFSPDGFVGLYADDYGPASLCLVANDSPTSWHNFLVEGEDALTLEMQMTEDGLILSGNLENVTVNAYEDPESEWEKLSFSTEEDSVLVTEESGSMQILADEDGDGEYTDPINKEPEPFTVFEDVSPDAWYANAVKYVYQNNLMAGISETMFSPSGTVSRAQTAQVVWNKEGKPSAVGLPNPFNDVPNTWYTNAVIWCKANGVVSGTSSATFAPDNQVSREQIAVILYNFTKSQGIDVSDRAPLTAFPDRTSVSSWAWDAVSWAVASGLISGRDGSLAPQGTASRAEMATILMQYSKNIM